MEELLLELSNRLKKRYIDRAASDAHEKGIDAGIAIARQTDAQARGDKESAESEKKKARAASDKGYKRQRGIFRAMHSMKESMQLDELSRKTIDSYIKKRSTQAKVQATAAKRLEASAEKKNQKVFAAVRHLLTKEETILETEMRSRDDDSAQPRRIAKNKKYNEDPHKDKYVNNPEPRHLDGRTKEFDKATRSEPHTQRFNWGKRHTESDKRKIASGTHAEVKNKDGSVSTKPTEKHYKNARERYLARRTPEQKARDERSAAAAKANTAGRKLNAGDLVTSDAPNLQELRKATLRSYLKKAEKEQADAAYDYKKARHGSQAQDDAEDRMYKRDDKMTLARKKLTTAKEEVELQELSTKTMEKAYSARMNKARHHRSLAASTARNLLRPNDNPQVRDDRAKERTNLKKADKTLWHLVKRTPKKVNEESLQELSKGTLVSYIQQAAIDAASASRYSKDDPKMKKKVTKRLRGIAKASQKLEK